jgi:hypothetical protein
MPGSNFCRQCGAVPQRGMDCRGMFEEMIAREFEDPLCGQVHHLTVICFNLQHSLDFTPAALAWSRNALEQVLEQGIPPGELRRRSRQLYDGPGKPKVTRQAQAGEAAPHVAWTMTIANAVGDGRAGHPQRVQAWAQAVLGDLKKYGLYAENERLRTR